MAESNVDGIRGEYRRLTSAEVGVMIRAFREGQGIKRAVLAADANMSEKTLERAEGGQCVSEDSMPSHRSGTGPARGCLCW